MLTDADVFLDAAIVLDQYLTHSFLQSPLNLILRNESRYSYIMLKPVHLLSQE
jgi:hypothetical protein